MASGRGGGSRAAAAPAAKQVDMTAQHTILLIQVRPESQDSRTYREYNNLGQAMDGIIKMYERRLSELNPGVAKITYELRDLHAYIDALGDCVAMVFDPRKNAYSPFPKDWVKQALVGYLKKISQQ